VKWEGVRLLSVLAKGARMKRTKRRPMQRRTSTAVALMITAVFLLTGAAFPAQDGESPTESGSEQPGFEQPGNPGLWGTHESKPLLTAPPKGSRSWTIDYCARSVCDSHTSYEFGTPEPPPTGWTPLSRLEFPIDSWWHGLQAGVETQNWDVHLQWIIPMRSHIQGDLEDYDWTAPGAGFTDLGVTHERWLESHMVNLDLDLSLWRRPFDWPCELWAIGGFRWQRLDIMAYDLAQLKSENVWLDPPFTYQGDVLELCQDYYITYLGGQIRTVFGGEKTPPVRLMFQGDWGNVQAFNFDHHLLREGDRYTRERTHGDSWHLGLDAQVVLAKRVTAGAGIDYMQIRTTGSHCMVNVPLDVDEKWSNGVRVWSDQLWFTFLLGLRI